MHDIASQVVAAVTVSSIGLAITLAVPTITASSWELVEKNEVVLRDRLRNRAAYDGRLNDRLFVIIFMSHFLKGAWLAFYYFISTFFLASLLATLLGSIWSDQAVSLGVGLAFVGVAAIAAGTLYILFDTLLDYNLLKGFLRPPQLISTSGRFATSVKASAEKPAPPRNGVPEDGSPEAAPSSQAPNRP